MNSNRYETGFLAISKAGHDCGEIYVIMGSDNEYVYLANGKTKIVDRTKKKKKKHIQAIKYMNQNIQTKLGQQKILTNEDVKRAIKLYKNNLNNQKIEH